MLFPRNTLLHSSDCNAALSCSRLSEANSLRVFSERSVVTSTLILHDDLFTLPDTLVAASTPTVPSFS